MPDQPKLTKQVPSGMYVMVARKKGENGKNGGRGNEIATNRKSQWKGGDMMECIEVMTQKVTRPDEHEIG